MSDLASVTVARSGPPPPAIDVAALVDQAPISGAQWIVFTLCGLACLVDGYDMQMAGSVAPLLSDALHIPIRTFGIVFAAGYSGILVGSLLLGFAADRLGRKGMILLALVISGVFTMMVPVLDRASLLDMRSLMACRFLAGLGIGGVVPNVLALTAEFAPRRSRALIVNAAYGGVPLGAVLVSLITAYVAPSAAWQDIFIIGGVVPVALAALCLTLPESARYLVLQGASPGRVAAVLRRMAPGELDRLDPTRRASFVLDEASQAKPSLRQLLSEARALPTTLLWVAMFLNLLSIVFVLSWLPLVMRAAGIAMQTGVVLAGLFSLGGIGGAIAVGVAIDRLGAVPVLLTSFVAAAVAVAGYGLVGTSVPSLYVVTLVAGVMVIGAQSGLTAFAAGFYPTSMRSTGLGWALGVGRLGSIVGPVLGGVMLTYNWSVTAIFLAAAVPSAASALIILLIARVSPALTRQSA